MFRVYRALVFSIVVLMPVAQTLTVDTSSEPLQINDVITVTGGVLDHFCVNFFVDSDIALHFVPRCSQNVVVRNTKKNGNWGTEERSGGVQIPCSEGDDISLRFKLTALKWEVSSFGQRIADYDYAHRDPSSLQTTSISFGGVTNPAIFINSVATFTQTNSINGQTATCVEGEECTVICGALSCGGTIICAENEACSVHCEGDAACYHATINWPTLPGLGTLSCDGEASCDSVNFPVPDPNTPYSVECDSPYECYGATINCPESATCSVLCTADQACVDSIINWH